MAEQTTEPTPGVPTAAAGDGPPPAPEPAGQGLPDQPAGHEAPTKVVPVSEAIKYRRRAQQAESRLQQIEQQLNELQSQFEEGLEHLATAEARGDELQNQLESERLRARVERTLHEAGVTDLEAAVALLEKRSTLDPELDEDQLAGVVDQLLQDKPFLVAAAPALPGKTASARVDRPGLSAQLAQAATRAATSGNRRDVAEYLRLRRRRHIV